MTQNPFPASFRRFLVTDATLLMSTSAGQIVVPWIIATHGGAKHLAVYGTCMGIGALVSLPLLAPLGDRLSKQVLVTAALTVCVIQAVAMAALIGWGHYDLLVLIVLGAMSTACMSLALPILANIPAQLVSPAQLTSAINLQKGVQSIGRFSGPMLAGVLISSAGEAAALLACALFSLICAGLSMNLGLPRHVQAVRAGSRLAAWWRDLRSGTKASWAVPLDRSWAFVNFFAWIFAGPAVGMLVPLKVTSLGLSGVWFASCEAGLAVGILTGSFYLSAKLANTFGRYNVRVWSGLILGLSLALAGAAESPYVLVCAFVLCGISNSALLLVGLTHRTLARPLDYRTRMVAASMALSQVASAAGPALAGVALTFADVSTVYVAFGVLTALAATAVIFINGFKEFLSLSAEEVTYWYQKRYPSAFEAADSPAARP